MSTTITKIIEQYLENELSPEDKAAFEQRLMENATLRTELERLQRIRQAAGRAAVRTIVVRVGKRYHFLRKATFAGIAVGVLLIAAILTWIISGKQNIEEERLSEEQLVTLYEQLSEKAPLEHIPVTYFYLQTADTVVLSETGVLLSVPERAFLLNGQSYSGAKIVQWQEATDAAAIVKAGLSTVSGNRLLETQGMFGMQAFTPDGKQLEVNPKVGVYVQVPVDELKEGMQLFEGKRMKNGQIDWQNPQPLEKLPVMASMNELDFYPPGYEAKLDELKWKTGKKDRDSLYLSMDQVEELIPTSRPKEQPNFVNMREQFTSIYSDTIQFSMNPNMVIGADATSSTIDLKWTTKFRKTGKTSGEITLSADLPKGFHIFSVEHDPIKADLTGIATTLRSNQSGNFRLAGALRDGKQPVRAKTINGLSVYMESTAEFVQDFESLTDKPFRLEVELEYQICNSEGCIFPPVAKLSIDIEGLSAAKIGIPPSKVLAFWQPKFDETILATRDFEKRMRSVHGTCSEAVLDLYTDNLNKPLYEIDAQVASMGYAGFSDFAAERVGGVRLDNPHMNNLRQFYAHATAQLRKQAKKDRNLIRKLESGWDRLLEKARRKQLVNSNRRQRGYAQQETTFNYPAMARQLGSRNTIGFTIRNGGPRSSNLHNVDRYARTPLTNQPITIVPQPTVKYSEYTASIANAADYERVLLYLFPHELNSYQRIDAVNGKFSTRLNDAIRYDVLLVGMNESGFAIAEKHTVSGGGEGNVTLQLVTEQEFNNRMEFLNANRCTRPAPVALELDWLLKERANYKVQRLRLEQQAFRNTIRSVVFPCGVTDGTEWQPATDMEVVPEEQIQM